jgi:dTDP-4-dehydrorhamnose reductase
MKKILVTGSSGLLGLNLSLSLAGKYEVVGIIHRDELKGAPFLVIVTDLSWDHEAEKIIERFHPDMIIHTAAMANVDICESKPQRAQQVNAVLPGTLAQLSQKHSIPLLHISTDAVFDGEEGDYSECDAANPISVYSRTKYEGEQNVAHENPGAIIARVNFFGWSLRGDRSLAEFFAYKLLSNEPVNGFMDVFFCTLHVSQLISVLMEMLEKGLSGLYHVVSQTGMSKYDFGVSISRQFGIKEDLVKPISVKEAGLKAPRSLNLKLNTQKLAGALGHELPTQVEGLRLFHNQYNEGWPHTLRSFLNE